MGMTPEDYAAAVASAARDEASAVAAERAASGQAVKPAHGLEARMEILLGQQGAPGTVFVDQCVRAGDKGAGQMFNFLHVGQLQYVAEMGQWMKWSGNYWQPLYEFETSEYVEDVAEAYKRRYDALCRMPAEDFTTGMDSGEKRKMALLSEFHKAISRLHNSRGPDNCLKFALADRSRQMVHADQLDTNPYLIATDDCVIDIRTGESFQGRPSDNCTRHTSTKWKGLDEPCELWMAMVFQVLGENEEVFEYFHRLLGMAICGKVSEKNFILLYGSEGDSGKTTIFEILREVLKDYAAPMPVELLLDQGMPQNPNSPTPAIMGLRGQRLCWASEPGDNRRFSVERVKLMSGGDSLMGRYPYDKQSTVFTPTHTLFMLSNHEPHAASTDSAFWKRLRKLDCPFEFVDDPKPNSNQRKVDRSLKEKILTYEASGVLAWLVRGYQAYVAEGVQPPDAVIEATLRYREQEDRVLQFKHECLVDWPGHDINGGILYEVFAAWFTIYHGRKVPSATIFGRMAARTFEKVRTSHVRYRNIGFRRDVVHDFKTTHVIPDECMCDVPNDVDDTGNSFDFSDDIPC